jgi:hypothetical protein
MLMDGRVLETWAARCAGVAARAGAWPIVAEDPGAFRDEFGHRRGVDGPLLAWLAGCGPEERPGGGPGAVHERLWWMVNKAAGTDGRWVGEVEGWLSAAATARAREGVNPQNVLVVYADLGEAIEVATEGQLCALHALAHLAGVEGRLWPAVRAGAERLLEHVQPDNATNLPWAVHVFARLASEGGTGASAAEAYAGTLLHNCQVTLGRADARSARILADAARTLRRWGAGGS